MRTRSRIRPAKLAPPSTVWLSDNFLLSDFLGCDSVYRNGYANSIPSQECLHAGAHLCTTLLESVFRDFGVFSISYGYISPDLSKKVVSYQNPDLPSYHRWDSGAAADICVFDWVDGSFLGKEWSAPVLLAHEIDMAYDYSRMITYSESPFICVATKESEKDKPRKAFYENRYTGVRKPAFIRKPVGSSRNSSLQLIANMTENWRGAGYPTYHGGGRKQFHHIRVGKYSVLSDFLYNDDIALSSQRVRAPVSDCIHAFYTAGRLLADMYQTIGCAYRLPIVRGYVDPAYRTRLDADWVSEFSLDVAVQDSRNMEAVAEAALSSGLVHTVSKGSIAGTLRLQGKVVGYADLYGTT